MSEKKSKELAGVEGQVGQPSGLVSQVIQPLVSVDEAVRMWQEYLELKKRLLDEDDYQYFVKYKVTREGRTYWKTISCDNKAEAEKLAKKYNGKIEKRIVKRGVKKYDRSFGIRHKVIAKRTEIGDSIIIERVKEDGDTVIQVAQRPASKLIRVSYEVMAIAPNGQFTVGNGVCSNAEPGKEKKSLHDIEATALTRAKNRATMDLVGGGEVTAEEITHSTVPVEEAEVVEEEKATMQQRKKIFAVAKEKGISETELRSMILDRYGTEHTSELTKQQASELIDALLKLPHKTPPKSEPEQNELSPDSEVITDEKLKVEIRRLQNQLEWNDETLDATIRLVVGQDADLLHLTDAEAEKVIKHMQGILEAPDKLL